MQPKRLLALVVALAAMALHVHFAQADYLVRPGDTLDQVADRLGVPVEELAAANGLDDPDFIVAGRLLVVPSDGGSATEYLVREGDTLSDISDRVGIPLRQLAAANGLDDLDWVPAGRLLSVPPVGASTSATAAPPLAATASSSSRYTVRQGDALSDIALELGVPAGQLAAANGITDPDMLTVGQVISVPNAWECPLPEGSFVNDYGYVTPEGERHNGVDLFAPRGTPIVAPVGGVAEPFPNNLGGNAIQLYGRDGNRYYFAHLDEFGETGTVDGGTVVGYVGNSGNARTTSPHLHFEIHPGGHFEIHPGGGESINPFPSLVAACR
ncbi:MAG: LysM peptidoglycan-binding domain-containing protein [Acidimicrobiales bacterium]